MANFFKTLSEFKIEITVVLLIAVFIIVASLFVSIPQTNINSRLPILADAPELKGINGWINSDNLSIQSLRGNVVLVDFWTYSCINCIRTLPYLNSWHEKYSDKGLVIIGVHTPEFEFEKDYKNVKMAVEQYGIKYSVAQDNNYETWRAYSNRYWPRKYLVDVNGKIRYDHIGEGAYQETEQAIQELLKEIKPDLKVNMTNISSDVDFSQISTPELYLGYNFLTVLGNLEGLNPETITDYKNTSIEKSNRIYLFGKWLSKGDKVVSVERAKLFLRYKSKNVNIVASGNSTIKIYLDSLELKKDYYGKDVEDRSVNIKESRLYNIISSPSYEEHLLEIDAEPGFELYTFTFG